MINAVCVCFVCLCIRMCGCAEATKLVIRSSGVPIHGRNFSLTCEITGSYQQIYWLKNGTHLNTTSSWTNETMSNHTENNALHFTPLALHDDGVYKCVVINQASKHQSPAFMLLVNCECHTQECDMEKNFHMVFSNMMYD